MKKLLTGIFLLLFIGTLLMFQHVFNSSKKVAAVVSTLKIGGTGATSQMFDKLRINGSLGVGYDAPVTTGNAIFSGSVGLGTTAPLLKLDVAGSGRFTGASTSVLTGSIDPIASTTVTGVGTLFLTELVPGDRITVTGVTKTVTTIASNTSLTVDTAFTDLANDTSPDKLPAIFVARDSSNVVKMAINNSGTTDLTALALGGTTVSATAAELNYVSGVTSALQTQLGLKAPLSSPTFTGTVSVPAPVNAAAAVTKSYVDAAGGLTVLNVYCGWSGTAVTGSSCTQPSCPSTYTSAGDLGCLPVGKGTQYAPCSLTTACANFGECSGTNEIQCACWTTAYQSGCTLFTRSTSTVFYGYCVRACVK